MTSSACSPAIPCARGNCFDPYTKITSATDKSITGWCLLPEQTELNLPFGTIGQNCDPLIKLNCFPAYFCEKTANTMGKCRKRADFEISGTAVKPLDKFPMKTGANGLPLPTDGSGAPLATPTKPSAADSSVKPIYFAIPSFILLMTI